jgi:multisubunit Na+/H+ antiporter MnhC subunit
MPLGCQRGVGDRLAPLPKEAVMGLPESLVLISAVVGIAVTFLYLGRSRARVMQYHGIPTPRVNEMTHGGGASG